MNKLINLLISFLIAIDFTFAKDFRFSKVKTIPDFSFVSGVFTGLDILEQLDFSPLQGKTVALLCNQTAVNRKGEHILDILAVENIKVQSIFSPEFGLFGDGNDRIKLNTEGKNIEPITGAVIYDLFGEFVYPPDESLNSVDLILINIQDTGVRYSTFITTITKIFETASQKNIPVLILDYPNPLRGDIVDGPVVRPEYQSFEGYHLVPVRHGLTVGEFLIMVNEMGWAKDLARVNLTVVPMANWKRNYWFSQTELPWIQPAPDIHTLNSLFAYSGMALLKGTNLNIGHGTDKPYLRLGAPWISGKHVLEKLQLLDLDGVHFTAIKYKPSHRQGMTIIPQYHNEFCNGIELEITDWNKFNPLETATSIIITIQKLYPREFQWAPNDYIDRLYGSNVLRTFVAQKKPADYLPPLWFHDVMRFSEFRKRFLIY